jgi:2-hydroxy-3-keto-5-methylthiopentenyl-1-phosphate phosphatase
VLHKQGITAENIKDVLEAANIGFRCEGKKFLKLCEKNNLNLAIVSGGVSDVIATILSTVININNYPNL